MGTKFDKDPHMYSIPSLNGSLFNIWDLKTAKARKDMFQPYFSKAAIQRVETLIQDKVSKFLDVLKKAVVDNKVIDLSLGYRCLTADVVMNYCYQSPLRALHAPDFKFPLVMALDKNFETVQSSLYFPEIWTWIFSFVAVLPSAVQKRYLAPIAATHSAIQVRCPL